EPYDSRFVLIKPVMNHFYFHIYSSRKELLLREKDIERSIQSELINAIREDRDNIQKYIQSVTLLDIIFAKCRLSRRFQCTRPQINEDGHIHISQLEYIPLKEICISKQRPYSSLTAEFDNRNIVITGSNMGGKTVLLKSVLFCQLLVQQGFFIPAGSVRTILFDAINLVGNLNDENSRGLSSFGEEIMNLIDSHHTSRSLYIVDEFARTTNSIEAYALNSALLQWFSECPHIYSFMSTHQENFPEFESVSNWSMKGLNYKKYKKYFHLDYDCDLEERIQLITDYMDYGVEPEKTGEIRRDALKIADILGLNSEILNYAEKYIKDQE
ncbi:MAG: hypothetical protein JEY91_17210, partial [Spirochaetaceae bacterium]|nr:hypothetical protein [Spirochaetaceae bacterium]